MSITEPTTMLTDYALGALCLWLGWKLYAPAASRRQTAVKLWAGAFFATALASFVGGTYHGFTSILSGSTLEGLWKVTVYFTGFSSFFLLSAVLVADLPHSVRRWAVALCALKLVVYLVWMVTHDDFLFVVYDYGSAMILILVFQVRAFYKFQSSAAGWIVGGILLSFVGAAIQQSGFSLHQHFNHNDLFHVVQMVAFYLLYRGGKALGA
jgi:hypothetical protein